MINVLTSIFILLVLYEHAFYFGLPIGSILTPTGDSVAIFLAIGGFIFLSGYKITLTKRSLTLKQFIMDRFFRLYPLYFLALVIHHFFIQPGNGNPHFWLHAGLLNMIFYNAFGAPFLTVYFVGLLALYYTVFVITKSSFHNTAAFVCLSVLLFLMTAMVHLLKPFGIALFEERFFMYYPFFFGGITAALHTKSKRVQRLFHPGVWGAVFVLVLTASIKDVIPDADALFRGINVSYVFIMPSYLAFLVSLVVAELAQMRRGFFARIAQATYCMFLFHRPAWLMATNITQWAAPNLTPAEKWIVIYILGTVVLYWVSLLIQRGYNLLIRRGTESIL